MTSEDLLVEALPLYRILQSTEIAERYLTPTFATLQILLKQIIDQSSFAGIVDLNLLDLQTSAEMHFAYQSGQNIQAARWNSRAHLETVLE